MFACGSDQLIGVLHSPADVAPRIGVLIVVGGPQYRIGSHRQFVLLARAFAAAGYATFRFDYRGMGDSDGGPRSFEQVGADLQAAAAAFLLEQPDLDGIVMWGLCDGAAAILMSCAADSRLRGVILANPWVRTTQGEARTYLKHYYLQRLTERGFWRKVLSGGFNPLRSVREIAGTLQTARADTQSHSGTFIERMLVGLETFDAPVLILMSERDLTAQEFADLCAADARWRAATQRPGVSVVKIPGADHTFSNRSVLEQAAGECASWLGRVPVNPR